MMNDHNTHLMAPTSSRLTRFAAGVAAARRPPTFDAGRLAETLPGEMHASQMPPDILRAIAAATDSLRGFRIAAGLFAVDHGEVAGADDVAQGRLERAVARALLDAWTEGRCSAEAVGSAYALVADRVGNDPQPSTGKP